MAHYPSPVLYIWLLHVWLAKSTCLRFLLSAPLSGSPTYPLLPSYEPFSSLLNRSEDALGRGISSKCTKRLPRNIAGLLIPFRQHVLAKDMWYFPSVELDISLPTLADLPGQVSEGRWQSKQAWPVESRVLTLKGVPVNQHGTQLAQRPCPDFFYLCLSWASPFWLETCTGGEGELGEPS